jgi:hypothetical protein
VYLAPAMARLRPGSVAEKAGDSFVTVERLLLALALEKTARPVRSSRRRRYAAEHQRRDQCAAQGPYR